MSNAVILFQAAGQDRWNPFRTVEFDIRRTNYESVQCGLDTIDLQHVPMHHELLLTHGDTRVVLWPTSGNEPDDAAPNTRFELPVVGHYDVAQPNGTYRIYHAWHKNERR